MYRNLGRYDVGSMEKYQKLDNHLVDELFMFEG